MDRQALFQLFDAHREELLADYFEFLRFPSISSEPAHRADVKACANWLHRYVEQSGFVTEQWPTSGHPVIYAERIQDSSWPTLLIYNHYDVQPVDPLVEWESPAFEPTCRDGKIFARGAQDNKGQCFYVLAALRSLLRAQSTLPINVKLLIEGEEEIGSPGLANILSERAERLKADSLLVADLGLQSLSRPSVSLGVRGLVSMTVTMRGSTHDLHSGTFGGAAFNPNHALVQVLSQLRDSSGRVAVPNFYEDVATLTDEQRSLFELERDTSSLTQPFAIEPTGGEEGFSALERIWLRPTLEINGISGGYAGAGFKTVIPAQARAKISCRLVPNQQPQKVAQLVVDFIRSLTPKGVSVDIEVHPGVGEAVRANPNSAVVRASAAAFSDVHECPCGFSLEGGSIPIVASLARTTGAEVTLLGYGLPSDNMHAPNEHFDEARLKFGFALIGRILHHLGTAEEPAVQQSVEKLS